MGTIMNIVIGIAEIALLTFIGFCAGCQYRLMKEAKKQLKTAEELTTHAANLLMASNVADVKKAVSGENAETNEQKKQDKKL